MATASGLIANLANTDNNFIYQFEYLPEDTKYSRKVKYSPVTTPGVPTPALNYSSGELWNLSFTIFLDGLETGNANSVLNNIKFLESLTYPSSKSSSSVRDQQFKKPPVLKLILDGRYFCGVMESIEVTPLMRFANGNPARADVACAFIEVYNASITNNLYRERMTAQQNWNNSGNATGSVENVEVITAPHFFTPDPYVLINGGYIVL